MNRTVRLFSYGTLQLRPVQIANFGRELDGLPDALLGWTLDMVEITDKEVLAESGEKFHPILTPSIDPADRIEGTVFAITPDELVAADTYEVADYKRVEVDLASGTRAWVYVRA